MSLAAIIVASGSSRRMGFDKLAAQLNGKPVLWHSVRAFSSLDEICQVIVVTTPERFAWLTDLGDKLTRVDGGDERPDSVASGLAALRKDITHVAIHDGARPLVSPEAIRETLSTAKESGAAALARRVTETLKKATPQGITTESVSRDDLWIMETPQVFSVELIREAYVNVKTGDARITDEVSALQLLGHGTTLVENRSPNPKITVEADLNALR
ncbi:MAG: 2-C-methyl-D-erythritol 4-phosphate cytidylyltransferase [Verrucomicrobiaceae bacterium]